MNKVFLLLLTLVSLSFGDPVDRTGPYIAVGGGYAVFEDDLRMEAGSQGVNPSYNLNIIGGAFINRYLSVELAYDYYDTFVNDLNENTTKLYIVDVAAKAHYPFWKDRIDLYGAFGAGQVFWVENLNGVSRDDRSGTLRGDVGVGFRALKWLTFNVGYRRYFFTLDHETGTDSEGNVIYKRYYMDLSSGYANIEVQFLMRLDQYLVEAGFVDSRTKAQTLIKARKVSVDGKPVTKPAFKVSGEKVEIADEMIYVSRGAHKLKGFLPSLPFSPKGLDAIDIGASTGGFTQVLLEAGAKSVTCVDVGQGQLHQKLLDDKRVISFEKMDIRDFPRQRQFDLVTSDVSFISLHHILESVDALGKKWIILLFKPQFEVGRDVKRDSNGVVLDQKAIANAQTAFEEATAALGWKMVHHEPSSISGKEGNIEECYCFEKC